MTETLSIETALRQVHIFSDASDDGFAKLAAISTQQAVSAGSLIIRQGEPAVAFYVLLGGNARLCQITKEGRQITLRKLTPGQLFGAFGIAHGSAKYPACAEALEDCHVLAIPADRFTVLAKENPTLSFSMLKLMSGYLHELQEHFSQGEPDIAERRIARAMLTIAHQSGKHVGKSNAVEVRFTRQSLAEQVGTTLFTVSRILRRWQKSGYLIKGRERIIITNPHLLMQLAEGFWEPSWDESAGNRMDF
jgi:CRP-like cAMP-binding protein